MLDWSILAVSTGSREELLVGTDRSRKGAKQQPVAERDNGTAQIRKRTVRRENVVKFFIPYLEDAPEAAEAEWQRYLRDMSAPPDSQRAYSVTYDHEGSRIIATVGEQRLEYPRKRRPRGGYTGHAGLNPVERRTGTEISAIIDAGHDLIYLIYVWIYGSPFGEWANPSLIERSTVEDIEYFETPPLVAPHIRLDLKVSDYDSHGRQAIRNS